MLPRRKPSPIDPRLVVKPEAATGHCLCGKVRFEIDIPARWAFHDHSLASRLAHGAAYATYVGSWRKRFRLLKGASRIRQFTDTENGLTRSFCGHCGTPVYYEREGSPHMINIPRALFASRTGREPRYHLHILEKREWAYEGEALAPLPGFPGVVWSRPKKRAARA